MEWLWYTTCTSTNNTAGIPFHDEVIWSEIKRVRGSLYNLAAVHHFTICIAKFPCFQNVHKSAHPLLSYPTVINEARGHCNLMSLPLSSMWTNDCNALYYIYKHWFIPCLLSLQIAIPRLLFVCFLCFSVVISLSLCTFSNLTYTGPLLTFMSVSILLMC